MLFNFLRKKFIDESLEKQKEDLAKSAKDFYTLAANGKDCDSLFNDKQNFGHNPDNPIPVNGVLGEVKYLNRLRCKYGSGLLYHRLGSVTIDKIEGNIDVYETVCLDGKHWDILYFHFYHPRRSVWLPKGYKFSDFHPIYSQYPIGYGTNNFDSNFPFGLGRHILTHLGEGLGRALIKKYDKIIEDKNQFIRPEKHKVKLSYLAI